MKKSLLAIAALTAFAGAAQAQSSVTVYGILDVGVMGQSNSNMINGSTGGASAGLGGNASKTSPRNGNSFGFMSGGESTSRLGFKGEEDLGGGTKAIFQLEQQFSSANGSENGSGLPGNGTSSVGMGNLSNTADSSKTGQLFNGMAYAGLSNDKYGTLTMGRQLTLMADNIGAYDPIPSAQFSPLGIYGAYGGGGTTDNGRANGAFKYKQNIMGFNIGALYAPGGYAGANSVGQRLEGQIGYEKATWGIVASTAYQADSTNLGGVTYGTATGTSAGIYNPSGQPTAGTNMVNAVVSNTRSAQLTAKWQPMDKLMLKTGFMYWNIGTPSGMQYLAGQPVLPNGSGFSVFNYQAMQSPKIQNTFWLGANYDFTPAIKGSLAYYQQNTNGGPSNISSIASGTGRTTWITASTDYYLSKRTNLYVIATQANLTGNNVATSQSTTSGLVGTPITQQFTYGLGMRHTF